MAPHKHPLPLLCVGSCYIPLEGGQQATTSAGQKLVCAARNAPPGKESSQHLTVPLNFGLEMVASFPKSYRWLSEQTMSNSSSPSSTSSTSSPSFALFDLVVKDVNCQSPLSPAGECDSILSQGRCLGRADQ